MNKGLKNYTKQITHEIGNAKASVNLFKDDSNLHIELPLLSTVGLSPFSASLIYNYQDRTQDGKFGKGYKLNFYGLIDQVDNVVSIRNADGSSDTYAFGVWNKETQTIARETNKKLLYSYVDFEDRVGNVKSYGFNREYPKKITMATGESISINVGSKPNTIENGKGDVLKLHFNENDIVNLVEYSHNDETLSTAELTYTDGIITRITYKLGQAVASSVSVTYGSDYIIVKDDVSNYRIKYCITNDAISSFIDGFDDSFTHGSQSTLAYGNRYTVITDKDGKKEYVFFDKEGMPLFEMDEDGNVVKTNYDKSTKRLLATSSVITTKQNKLTNIFPSENISSFAADGVTVTKVDCADEVFSSILGNSVYKATGVQRENGNRKLSKRVSFHGVASENVSAVIWGKQLYSYTGNDCVSAQLIVGNKKSQVVKFDKTSADGNFDVIVLGVTADETFDSVELDINFNGCPSIEIGGIQVLKKDFGAIYNYDYKGNMQNSSTGSGSSDVEYNDKNLPKTVIGEDSSKTECEYEENNNIKRTIGAYGVTTVYEYDDVNKSNLTSTTISTDCDLCMMETTKEYTSDGRFVSKTTDELGNSTLYEYDNLGRIKKVTNALNVISQYVYNGDGTLNKLILGSGDAKQQAEYNYDDKKRLSKITLANGSVYSFAYDNYNNVTSISLNGTVVFTYEYDLETGNIITQKYGSYGDGYRFEYNSDGLITAVKYYFFYGRSDVKFQYAYNSKKQLVRVTDANSNVIAEYEYDDEGNIIKSSNAKKEIVYAYDKSGAINAKSTKVDGKTINTSFTSASKSKGVRPDSLMAAFSDKPCSIITFDRTTGSDSARAGKEGVISYGETNNDFDYQYSNLPAYDTYGTKGCVQFWIKPKTNEPNSRKCAIMTLQSKAVNNRKILAYLMNNYVKVFFKDDNGAESELISMPSNIDFSKWNFFSLNFVYRKDTETSPTYVEYALTLNEKTQIYKKQGTDIPYMILYSPELKIGVDVNSSNVDFPAKITALYASRDCLKLEEVKKYYLLSKDYIIDSQLSNGLNLLGSTGNLVDFSQTDLHTIDSSIQNQFEIYPLHNNLLSLKGKKPQKYSTRIVSKSDKDRTFNFNNKIKRYAYVADGGELAYSLGDVTDISVVMRACTDVNAEKQYFFEGTDRNGRYFGLYRVSDSKVYIDFDGTIIDTGLSFSSNEWHTVAFSRDKSFRYDSLGEYNESHLRVMIDGNVYSTKISVAPVFNGVSLMIGRKTVGTDEIHLLGDEINVYPLYGQIEMLAIDDAYCETTTMNKLFVELAGNSRIHAYDELGRLSKVDLHKDGTSILENTYLYKYRPNFIKSSTQILAELISTNDTQASRIYTTDALGRVTAVDDEVFGSHSYTYDHRGYLVNVDKMNYEYDNNGNITKIGEKTLKYDTVIKDRLTNYGSIEITYDTHNPLNPIKYGNFSFSFEGRRLTKVTLPSGYFEYTYNDQGLRTKKYDYRGATTYYEYDGDKLIYQQNSSGRLDFLYDENGELYGFIKDSSEKYFYVRDCLKNILGIVDNDGNLVVKYSYDAFGTCTNISGNNANNIGSLNPFRFKGYYYDQETGFYYCQSRYYVPSWGRWLNGDSSDYIETDSSVAVNLFVYCGNDPISGIDPSGNVDWKRIGKAIGIILGAVAIVAITVATAGAGSAIGGVIISGTIGVAGELFSQTVIENKSFADVNYWQVAIAGVSSAVSAIPGVGLFESALISGATGALSSFAGGNRDISILYDGLKSAGITALAGGITRCIGLAKISKIGKGKYAGKKGFLKGLSSHKMSYKLSSNFNPQVNKAQGLISYIHSQVGFRGVSRVASESAGTLVNTISDIITSLF